jgi:hypothetical protein
MKPKVFVTEDTRHNLAHAMEFGDIVILEREDFPQFRNGQEVVDRMRRALSDFTTSDYLLVVGDPILMGLAFAILKGFGFNSIRVLKWDRQATRYIPHNVPLA